MGILHGWAHVLMPARSTPVGGSGETTGAAARGGRQKRREAMRWVVVLVIAASICWVAPAWVALLFVGGYLLAHRIEILQDRVHELERERRTEGDTGRTKRS